MKLNKGHAALRKARTSLTNHMYHITFATKDREPYLMEFNSARSVIKSMMFCEEKQYAKTIAFCIMPDHVHWLLQLEKRTLEQIVRSVKRYTSNERLKWARGFYDSGIREQEQLITVARYIIANPKRAGIVNSVKDYPHWDCVFL